MQQMHRPLGLDLTLSLSDSRHPVLRIALHAVVQPGQIEHTRPGAQDAQKFILRHAALVSRVVFRSLVVPVRRLEDRGRAELYPPRRLGARGVGFLVGLHELGALSRAHEGEDDEDEAGDGEAFVGVEVLGFGDVFEGDGAVAAGGGGGGVAYFGGGQEGR